MAILRGEPVDRPAVNFYEIGGFKIDPTDPDPFNVYNDPSWRPLLALAEEHTDLIRMRSPVKARCHEVDAAHPADEFFKISQYIQQGRRFTRTVLQIGGRAMTSLTRRDPEVDTTWTVEPLLKSVDDVEAYLELPDEVFAEKIDVTGLIEEDRQLGERGIIMIDTEDPLCAAASLFSMEDYMVIAMTQQSLFHRLLGKLAPHIQARTAVTAQAFPGHLWRIYGPEYAAEPYLPPHLFDEYVVRYTGPMVKAIQRHGGFARIHCHGRTRAVLDSIAGMHPAAIDPIEPPPQGDAELAYVRDKYGLRLALFGGIEYADVENAEPAAFEKIVQKALIDGTQGQGKGFVLMPSAAPIGRTITPQIMANYETMVRLSADFT